MCQGGHHFQQCPECRNCLEACIVRCSPSLATLPRGIVWGVRKTLWRKSLINELYNLSGYYCMDLNDVYSHEREKRRGITAGNTVRTMSKSEECSSNTDAALKAIRIINASVKMMYQMIESGKQGDPDNKEFHELLDYIGMATAGWYFLHEHSPRYEETQWRVTLVDVEEEELKE